MFKASQVLHALKSQKSLQKVSVLQRFFKTGPGEYGEGDVFWGITVPAIRKTVKLYSSLPLTETKLLLKSSIHEARLCALLMLVQQFQKGSEKDRQHIYTIYLAHTCYINNWDLVDLSADKIVGAYLENHPRNKLHTLAQSRMLWEKRIAMMATFHFIKKGDAKDALHIARILLFDPHDLIQKAVGWMLREIGKRVSIETERAFLNQYAPRMPRTALRYAIERMPPTERKKYLAKK